MIGKVIEGRYVGASVNKLPDRNVLYIQTEDGEKIALSKSNAISVDNVTDQYPSSGKKVLMVIWNDFEVSVIQLGITQQNKSNNRTGTIPTETIRKYNPTENVSTMTGGQQNNGIHFREPQNEPHSNVGKYDTTNPQILTTGYADNKKRSIPKQNTIKVNDKTGSKTSRRSVGVGYKVVFCVLCVILLLSGVFGKALINRAPTEEEVSLNYIEAFNALYASLTEENNELNDTERRNLIGSYAKKASLSCYAEDPFSKVNAEPCVHYPP